MKIVAIIQARMGSTRLPGKVLKPLVGYPMLWHIVQRVSASKGVDKVLVATSVHSENDVIRDFCRTEGIACFSGSEVDVLDRFHVAAQSLGAATVIRITADCPLVDPDLVSRLVVTYYEEGRDYMSVVTGAGALYETQPRFPDGLDAEVFSFAALERAWRETTKPTDREHVTPYIWRNSESFKLGKLYAEHDYSHLRFSVDRAEDFELISQIYAALYQPDRHFLLSDVLAFLENHPKLATINQAGIDQHGYEQLWQA
jgi:spore coat polysaccharide biosynthesis protein SpsF